MFDLDNDGQPDLVVKTTFCMRRSRSDSLYMFPADSAVLEQANWQDLSPLLATPDKFERTGRGLSLDSIFCRGNRRELGDSDRGLYSPALLAGREGVRQSDGWAC
jgi:hypothetical protein